MKTTTKRQHLTADAQPTLPAVPAEMVAVLAALVDGLPEPGAFGEQLDERLPRAASRWWRWFQHQWVDLSRTEQAAVQHAVWRGDPVVAAQLTARARALLGRQRSLLIERAVQVSFEDRNRHREVLQRRWTQLRGDPTAIATSLADLARLRELATPANVVATAWIALLHGETIDHALAEALADSLLERTSQWQAAVDDTERRPRSRATVTADLPEEWGDAHPTLVATVLLLAGLLADDPAVTAISLSQEHDPEDGSCAAVLRFRAAEEEAEVRARVLDRAARVGGLAVQADDNGGAVVLAAS